MRRALTRSGGDWLLRFTATAAVLSVVLGLVELYFRLGALGGGKRMFAWTRTANVGGTMFLMGAALALVALGQIHPTPDVPPAPAKIY